MSSSPRIILDGLVFAESPRWHAGQFWFVDMFARRVYRWALKGSPEVVAEFHGDDPSGLGFLCDGTPLVALMRSKKVMRLAPEGPSVYVDLADTAGTYLNDMVVDGMDRVYVDSVLRRGTGDDDVADDKVVLVTSDLVKSVATSEVARPNGIAVDAGMTELVVAEPPRARIACFRIEPDGSLSSPSVFAETSVTPDGLCLDAEGGVWYAGTHSSQFVRVLRGGRVTHQISVSPRMAVACTLGGADRRTLFMLTSSVTSQQLLARKPTLIMPPGVDTIRAADASLRSVGAPSAFVETVEVDVPGIGWP